VLLVEDWAEIRRLHRGEGMPIKAIPRVMGCSKNTVRAALRSSGPPSYRRPAVGSAVEAVEPRIRELLQAWPTMPATVIAERVGWTRSIRTLRARGRAAAGVLAAGPSLADGVPAGGGRPVRLLVPGHQAASGVGTVADGDAAAGVDDGLRLLEVRDGGAGPVPGRGGPVRRMVAADRRARAVPRVLVWDGEGAVGRWRNKRAELTGHCQAFRGVLGVKVLICKPGDPEAKGLVERFHDYLETSFLPGRAFTGPDDFNSQLSGWLAAANSPGCRRTWAAQTGLSSASAMTNARQSGRVG
jgi:transposase